MTAQSQAAAPRAEHPAWRRTLQSNGLLLAFTAFLIIFPWLVGAVSGTDATARRGEAVFQQSLMIEYLVFAMLAMSYNLMFGFTGVISFGHAMFFGMGGYLAGGIMRAMPGEAGVLVAVVAVVVVCAVVGMLISFVSLRLRGVYFAMFTLAIAEITFLFMRRNPATGGEDGFRVSGLPEWFDPASNRIVYYYIVVVIFLAMFLLIRRLIASPTGAVLLGIRENENRARAIGYNTLRFKVLAITLAGVLAGIAGILLAFLNKKAGPELLAVNFTVNPLLETIVGGVGTFTGPVIGALALGWLNRQLRNATLTIGALSIDIGGSWAIILGVIFIAAVILFPYGIVGTFHRWRARLQARRTDGQAPGR